MDEQNRRSEVLQAEEAIRLLAKELARAEAAADGSESAARRFDEALALFSDARDRLALAVQQAADAGEKSRTATESALAEVRASRETLDQARHRLSDAAETISTSAGETLGRLRQRFEESAAAFLDIREKLSEAVQAAGEMRDSNRQYIQEILSVVHSKLDEAGQKVTASIGGLDQVHQQLRRTGEEIAAKHNRLIQNVEGRLGELSLSLSAMSMAVQDLKRLSSDHPARLDQLIKSSLARQTRVLASTVIFTAIGLGAALVAIYILSYFRML